MHSHSLTHTHKRFRTDGGLLFCVNCLLRFDFNSFFCFCCRTVYNLNSVVRRTTLSTQVHTSRRCANWRPFLLFCMFIAHCHWSMSYALARLHAYQELIKLKMISNFLMKMFSAAPEPTEQLRVVNADSIWFSKMKMNWIVLCQTFCCSRFGLRQCIGRWYAVIPEIQSTPEHTHVFDAFLHVVQHTRLR